MKKRLLSILTCQQRPASSCILARSMTDGAIPIFEAQFSDFQVSTMQLATVQLPPMPFAPVKWLRQVKASSQRCVQRRGETESRRKWFSCWSFWWHAPWSGNGIESCVEGTRAVGSWPEGAMQNMPCGLHNLLRKKIWAVNQTSKCKLEW